MISTQRGDAYLFLLWVQRDLRARVAGSVAGLLWTLLLPLLTVAVFYVMFALVLQVRVPELAGANGYFYYLLAGLLPWLSLSEGLSRATGSLVAQEQFLQKLVFPVWVIPGTVVITSLLPQLVGTLALVILLALAGLLQPLALLAWPLLLAVQLLLQWGLGLALAVLGMHLRDLVQVLPVILQIFFYATPILYPRSLVPEAYQGWFLLNPFAGLMDAYHALFLGLPLATSSLLALGGWTLLLGLGGIGLFRLLKPTLGDYL
jgi:lipopolysaccharide transport system permease protein